MAMIHIKGEDRSVVRVVEVTQVNKELEEFGGWFYIHSKVAAHYDAERPMKEMCLAPEFRKPGGATGYIVAPQNRHKYERVTDHFKPGEVELVVTSFNLESGGKVPKTACRKCDVWLRQQAANGAERCGVPSEPKGTAARARIEPMESYGPN